MGICDLVPGISGGTIAFITGIYERLIRAVKGFSFVLLRDFFSMAFNANKKTISAFRRSFQKIDIIFLITLGAGIGSALLLGSRVMEFLIEQYFAFTMSFFVGLIVASSKIIYDHIENHALKEQLFGLGGFLFGIGLAFIIPSQVQPSLWYLFAGGFLAISAMFLPGISGSFILLILGIYEFMLDVLHHITDKLTYFFVFLIGAGLGAFSISRIVSYLFDKHKNRTLYVLLGLVVGCLSIPLKRIYLQSNTEGLMHIGGLLMFFVIGIGLVMIVKRIAR